MSILTVRGLTKRFGNVEALVDIDLDVAEGSRTAVVGPSGSGKTTLLRVIAGFESPDAGEVRLGDHVIATPSAGVPPHRRNIGLVMQEGALFPHLSVLENIRFGIRDKADSRHVALALMELVELDTSMAGRQPHQLSGGQQQRVALARALARKPRLMLLDEPFSALDAGLRDHMRQATTQILARAGVASMLVTHDRDEAMSFADQLIVLREGRLVQSGRPRDLYLAPADPTTAAFLGPAIVLDAELSEGHAHCILGAVPIAGGTESGNRSARILLRPAQLKVVSERPGQWHLARIEHIGSAASVTLEHPNLPPLTFQSADGNLPPEGSLVSIAVVGKAHVFP